MKCFYDFEVYEPFFYYYFKSIESDNNNIHVQHHQDLQHLIRNRRY